MLPEHIEKLKTWEDTLTKQAPPTPFMPWELEAIQQTVDIAYRGTLPISLTLFANEQWETLTGFIYTIDYRKAVLAVKVKNGLRQVQFDSIQGAEVDD